MHIYRQTKRARERERTRKRGRESERERERDGREKDELGISYLSHGHVCFVLCCCICDILKFLYIGKPRERKREKDTGQLNFEREILYLRNGHQFDYIHEFVHV